MRTESLDEAHNLSEFSTPADHEGSNAGIGPRWLHYWAIFTVAATYVLLLLGSLVTTRGVGMADPVWPTVPWFLFVFDWVEPRPGFIIEHSHRLAGIVVGCCAIVLAAGLLKTESRASVRWLGIAVLAGVILQGLLGGFRVRLNEWIGPNLALIHGCFAQVVVALMVCTACVTAPAWRRPIHADGRAVRPAALATVALIYMQIVFGAVLRHTFSSWGPRGHLFLASLTAAAVAWLMKSVYDKCRDRALVIPAATLGILVAVQLMLGIETWLTRFYAVDPTQQVLLRTAHVLTGSLILAIAVTIVWQTYRSSSLATASPLPIGAGKEVA